MNVRCNVLSGSNTCSNSTLNPMISRVQAFFLHSGTPRPRELQHVKNLSSIIRDSLAHGLFTKPSAPEKAVLVGLLQGKH